MAKFSAETLAIRYGRPPEVLRPETLALLRQLVDEVRKRPGRNYDVAEEITRIVTPVDEAARLALWADMGWDDSDGPTAQHRNQPLRSRTMGLIYDLVDYTQAHCRVRQSR